MMETALLLLTVFMYEPPRKIEQKVPPGTYIVSTSRPLWLVVAADSLTVTCWTIRQPEPKASTPTRKLR